jgi:copper chaperone CopZ
MKNLFFLTAFLLLVFSLTSNAQVITSEFIVAGKCDMCQKRILDATDLKGVKSAEWSPETQVLKITYKADKISLQEICQSISLVGHDTEYVLTSDKAYENLHNCCLYERLSSDSIKEYPQQEK